LEGDHIPLLKSHGQALEEISIYLSLFVQKSQKHNKSITYSGQDSDTTMVLNNALNTQKRQRKTLVPDQIKSGQLAHEIKTDSKLSMYYIAR